LAGYVGISEKWLAMEHSIHAPRSLKPFDVERTRTVPGYTVPKP